MTGYIENRIKELQGIDPLKRTLEEHKELRRLLGKPINPDLEEMIWEHQQKLMKEKMRSRRPW